MSRIIVPKRTNGLWRTELPVGHDLDLFAMSQGRTNKCSLSGEKGFH